MKWGPRVEEAAAILDVPGLEVSGAAIKVATEAIAEVDRQYGPMSDHPLAYHNAPHSLDYMGRAMRLLNLLHPYIDLDKWGEDIADGLFIGGADHDSEQRLGSGANERASQGNSRERVIRHSQGRKRPPWKPRLETFMQRVDGIIIVTETDVKNSGEIAQTNIAVGIPDPAKFISAFADINGIAMEGPPRMIQDCLNLYAELNKGRLDSTKIAAFLGTQSRFLRDRLHKNRTQSDLAYYFPDEAMLGAYRTLEAEFRDNILESAGLAHMIQENPEAFEALAAGLLSMASREAQLVLR